MATRTRKSSSTGATRSQNAAKRPRVPAATHRPHPTRIVRPPTAQLILDVARELYAKGGYSAVTVRAVAEKVGITSGAIYKHFSSKEDMFLSLQEQALALLVEMVEQDDQDDPVEHVRLYFWRYYEFSQQCPEYFRLLWVDSSAPSLGDGAPQHHGVWQLQTISSRRIEKCMRTGLFPKDGASAIARYLWSTIHGCAVLQMEGHWKGPDQWVANALDTSMLAVRDGLLQHDHVRRTSAQQPKTSSAKVLGRKMPSTRD